MADPHHIVPVLIPVALDEPYSYRHPAGAALAPGTFVRVPLGQRSATGVVWEAPPGVPAIDPARLRDVIDTLDVPLLGQEIRRFIQWVATYTLTPLGMVLRMVAMPRGTPKAPAAGVRLGTILPERMTPARQRVIDCARESGVWGRAALAREAGVSAGVIDALVRARVLERAPLMPSLPGVDPQPDFAPVSLSGAQAHLAAELVAAIGTGRYSASLLDGVTGSGKTEVYFEAIAACLRGSGQCLVLLPEIALTQTFLDRFAARFGAPPAPWHSGMTKAARARIWRGVASGEVRIVAGARSALFLPFSDLALIVVDEEHDPAYKQHERVIYNARDMAVVRASLGNLPIILSSATPSVETLNNAIRGRYRHLVLRKRYGAARLPAIDAIDMRREGPTPGHWIAPRLLEAITDTLARQEQVLLFLNRRGYAPLTLCRHCGHRFQCTNCTAWMVAHSFRNQLVCHHCGARRARPSVCPRCEHEGTLVACGPGVERVAQEVADQFPAARRMVLSSDNPVAFAQLHEAFERIARGDVDIVIGTQLIAKGHHFPHLTLVGAVDADLGLQNADPRAGERTFQLLQQVTGRAGRAEKPGRAFLQTYVPEHPIIKALLAMDREAFYAQEFAMREAADLPPFGRLAALIVSAPQKGHAEAYGKHLMRNAPRRQGDRSMRLFGPAEAPLAVLRGRHRVRILAQSSRGFDLSHAIRAWLARCDRPTGGVRLRVDIDPISFL